MCGGGGGGVDAWDLLSAGGTGQNRTVFMIQLVLVGACVVQVPTVTRTVTTPNHNATTSLPLMLVTWCPSDSLNSRSSAVSASGILAKLGMNRVTLAL